MSTIPPSTESASARLDREQLSFLWGLAASLAALGTAIAFDAAPGVNWGIWTAMTAIGLALVIQRTRGAIDQESALLLLLACALAFGAGVTANPAFDFFIFAGTAIVLALAMLRGSGTPMEHAGAVFLMLAPLAASIGVAVESVRRIVEGVGVLRAKRSGPALRGLALAAPIIAVFALLLAQADPLLAALRTGLFDALDHSVVWPRLIFFAALGAFMLGAYGVVLRSEAITVAEQRVDTISVRVGDTERLIVLGSVALLFALFLVLQLSYFFGNAPAVAGNGVTYAAYARRGFGELTVVASLTTMLIAALDRFADRGPRAAHVRLVALVLIALVQLLLESAYHRVMLYEQAYGYTAARLYAQVYMVVVSLVLLALGYEVWGAVDVRRLARRAAALAACALVALTYWNHDAWIARQNFARYAATGKLDVRYLTTGLSLNAVPMVLRSLPELSPPAAPAARECLRIHYAGQHLLQRRERWFEWSFRRAQAVSALRAAGIDLNAPAKGASCPAATG